MNTFEITIQHQPRGKNYHPVVVEYTWPDNPPIQLVGKFELDEDAQRQLKGLAVNSKKYGETLDDLLSSDRKLFSVFNNARSGDGLVFCFL